MNFLLRRKSSFCVSVWCWLVLITRSVVGFPGFHVRFLSPVLAVFLTGSDRIPILGMKSLKLVIQPTSGGEHYLPVAHTCFNLLDLPKYTSLETLRAKLLQAIDHNQGFNLA